MASGEQPLGTVGYRLMPFLRIVERGSPQAPLGAALRQLGYARSRPDFTVADVQAVVTAHPGLLDAWLRYSRDKETADGWYVLPDAEVGQVSRPSAQRHFASIEEAVAEFILRELDHHAGLAG